MLDSADQQRTIFAFVIMRTAEGARNAFNAARKVVSLFLKLILAHSGILNYL